MKVYKNLFRKESFSLCPEFRFQRDEQDSSGVPVLIYRKGNLSKTYLRKPPSPCARNRTRTCMREPSLDPEPSVSTNLPAGRQVPPFNSIINPIFSKTLFLLLTSNIFPSAVLHFSFHMFQHKSIQKVYMASLFYSSLYYDSSTFDSGYL